MKELRHNKYLHLFCHNGHEHKHIPFKLRTSQCTLLQLWRSLSFGIRGTVLRAKTKEGKAQKEVFGIFQTQEDMPLARVGSQTEHIPDDDPTRVKPASLFAWYICWFPCLW